MKLRGVVDEHAGALKDKQQQIAGLRQRLIDLEDRHAAVLEERALEIARLSARVSELEPLVGVRAEYEIEKERVSELSSANAAREERLTAEVEAHASRLAERERDVARLQSQLTRDAVENSGAAAAAGQSPRHRSAKNSRDQDATIARFRAQIAELGTVVAAGTKRAAKTDAGPRRGKRSSGAKERAERRHDRKPAPKPAPARRDDLESIAGIGPAMAKRLHKAGITTFAQIAEWNTKDVETIAATIRSPAKLIRSQHWVQNAKRLTKGPSK